MVDAVLDVAVHEGGEVVDGVVDAVVGDAALRIVVGADFGRAVAGGDEGLAARGNVVDVLLMLTVVDVGAQSGKGTFLVLWLVAGFRTFHKDFLLLARVGVGPHVAGTHTRLHLVHVLTASTRGAEGVPLDFTLVNLHVEGFGFGQYGHGGC